MYNYAASMGFLDGMSNIYLISTATLLLAVIIALYCANFLKEEESCVFEPEDFVENCEDNNEGDAIAKEVCSNQAEYSAHDMSAAQKQGDGLVSKLKSARLKELEAQLTVQQLEEERRTEHEQLAAIYELLKKQESELNTKELDQSELSAQLLLYR